MNKNKEIQYKEGDIYIDGFNQVYYIRPSINNEKELVLERLERTELIRDFKDVKKMKYLGNLTIPQVRNFCPLNFPHD